MKISERIKALPPYLFERVDQKKAEALAKGTDIIDLGIGDPDLPTPSFIIEAMKQALDDPSTHAYPSSSGSKEFKEAVASWYQRRFNVSLDPKNEVLSLIGSKEGIVHAVFTFVNQGDTVILPDPGYPAYHAACILAGAKAHHVPLKAENGYEIDFDAIDPDIAEKTSILFINYPQNPTGAVVSDAFFEKAIAFAKKYDILLCQDNAYSEISYDGYRPRSILEFPGAKDITIEFHSLSKTFNMTGWRIGMAVGNAKAIQYLAKFKSNVDSGIFTAIQRAGVVALTHDQAFIQSQCQIYQKRRDILVNGLHNLGWDVPSPKATFYVWAPVPGQRSSEEFVMDLLDKTGILVIPGNGYGQYGEGYYRMSITTSDVRLEEAIDRFKTYSI